MTFCLVTASYTLQPGDSTLMLLLGALAIIGIGLGTGVFNATLIRVLHLPSIIATLGTLSILQGASLLLRESPEGLINFEVIEALTTSIGFVPVAFIGVIVLAVARRPLALPHAHGAGDAVGRHGRDVVAAARDRNRAGSVPRIRRLLADGRGRVLLLRRPVPDRLADHRQLRARQHRGGGPRRRQPRRWARLLRGHAPRGVLPHADQERPAAVPAADRVRPDHDRRAHPPGARALPGTRAAGSLPHQLARRGSPTTGSSARRAERAGPCADPTPCR